MFCLIEPLEACIYKWTLICFIIIYHGVNDWWWCIIEIACCRLVQHEFSCTGYSVFSNNWSAVCTNGNNSRRGFNDHIPSGTSHTCATHACRTKYFFWCSFYNRWFIAGHSVARLPPTNRFVRSTVHCTFQGNQWRMYGLIDDLLLW